MKRNLMEEAHKMTREIVEKYGDVDYRTQLSLCLSFLAEGGKEMKKIEGKSEKQIRYAEDCREKRIAQFERRIERKSKKSIEGEKTTYKVRKTNEKLELTKVEAMQTAIHILQNMTIAWKIINACEFDAEILIYHYGQHR